MIIEIHNKCQTDIQKNIKTNKSSRIKNKIKTIVKKEISTRNKVIIQIKNMMTKVKIKTKTEISNIENQIIKIIKMIGNSISINKILVHIKINKEIFKILESQIKCNKINNIQVFKMLKVISF